MLTKKGDIKMKKTKALKSFKVVKSAPSYGVSIYHSGVKYTLVKRDIDRVGMSEKQIDKMCDAIDEYLDTFEKKAYNRVYYYAKKLNTKVDNLIDWYGY